MGALFDDMAAFVREAASRGDPAAQALVIRLAARRRQVVDLVTDKLNRGDPPLASAPRIKGIAP